MTGWRTAPGSTGRLLQLCAGYFAAYVLTGIAVKYFTGGFHQPAYSDITFLVHNTLGGSLLCLIAVFALGWTRLETNRRIAWGRLHFPVEALYIVPSGICTAAIIPTTTLMYTLPISVMVAMVIMRGSVIVISRVVDAIHIRQGILRKHVLAEENCVLLLPVAGWLVERGIDPHRVIGVSAASLRDGFDFRHSAAAMTILGIYVVAYAIRLYVMNYFKNTRAPGVRLDNHGYFAIEQVAASATLALVAILLLLGPSWGWNDPRAVEARSALLAPDPVAILSGIPFGIVAFFSVFLFMFQGRTATFAGLVNRLTSLLAGTAATLILAWIYGTAPPSRSDWASLALILIAVGFLARAERKRASAADPRSAGAAHAVGTPGVPVTGSGL
jgi:hypothetical protein